MMRESVEPALGLHSIALQSEFRIGTEQHMEVIAGFLFPASATRSGGPAADQKERRGARRWMRGHHGCLMNMAGKDDVEADAATDILPVGLQGGMMKTLVHKSNGMMQSEDVKIVGIRCGKGVATHFQLRAAQITLHEARIGPYAVERDDGRPGHLPDPVELRMNVASVKGEGGDRTLPDAIKGNIMVARTDDHLGGQLTGFLQKLSRSDKLPALGSLCQIACNDQTLWSEPCNGFQKLLPNEVGIVGAKVEIGDMNQAHEGSYISQVTTKVVPPVPAQDVECNSRTQETNAGMAFHRYFFVINPASGSANVDRLQSYTQERAGRLGKTVAFHHLQPSDDLPQVMEEAARDGAEVFVAAGGDGTLASVATEARRLGKGFGVIPCGTANVFAAEHMIPKGIEDAVDLVLDEGSLEPVDLVMVNDKAFLCHVSVGTYSWITTTTPQHAKKRFGRIAYLWNAVKLLFKERIWTFELEVDGQRMIRRASTIMVTNAGSMGATGLRWGDNIRTDDGRLEICIIRARNFRHYLSIFWALVTRKPHHPLKEYAFVENRASIKGPAHLPIRADGEEIGHGQFTLVVEKHGLNVLMPADARQNPNLH
jgi:diacylglycerol kinase (ATP)